MTINKNTDLEFSLQQKTEKGGVHTNFYTGDKGSASIRIRLSSNEYYLDLTKIDLKPVLFLFHEDGSIFEIRDFLNVMPDKGLIQYNISDNVIAHAGRVKAKLFLRNEEKSVHVANFTFDIKDSGIEGAVEKEISVNIVDDAVRRIVKENAIEILGDGFEGRLNNDVINHLDSNPELFKGADGKSLKYADLTEQQKEDLKSNITDQALTDYVISDNAVTPEKTTFFEIEKSTNLLDLSTIKKNTSVNAKGVEVEDSTRWLTDFIPLDSSIEETINATEASYRIALYDENKEFISRTGFIGTKYTPHTASKTKYVRLSGSIELSTLMINKGSELLPYEKPGYGRVKLKPEYYNVPEVNELEDNSVTPEKTTFFTNNNSTNLLDLSTIKKNTSVNAKGVEVEDSTRWLTDFIPLDSELEEQINFTQSSYRIALYDKDKEFISRTGVVDSTYYKTIPATKTKYVRLSGSIELSTLMINRGSELLPYEEPYGESVKIKEEYLPYDTNGNVIDDEIKKYDEIFNKKLNKVEQNIQTYTPSIPKLEFEEVTTGYYEALWLSKDGKRVYGKLGARLWVSYDECETFKTIIEDTVKSVQAVRELDDGELIFSTERDTIDHTQNGRVFKTKGFDKETGNIDSYDLKVETPSTESKINNSWGITTYKNVVTLSEYGLRTEEGARRAWLSTDYGETFKVIFDQKETTKLIEGAPTWTETAHMHTCSFDPYWNRIWIVTGDRPNSAMYYSDDFGETWKWVDVQINGDTMQLTGIIALPNCVVFGSDRNPNGVFVYYRGNKSDTPVIQPLLLVNDSDAISHVFQLPFKRGWDSLNPVYFAGPNAGDTDNKTLCVATVDGKKSFILHENNKNEKFGGKCLVFLGDTAQGNVIGTFFDDDISGFRIGKAKAPSWSKM